MTEAVRRKPYSVILLDEIEKAHPDVHEIFFQVFDKGVMEDGTGRRIDFKNTLIILTSNVGTETIVELSGAADYRENVEGGGDAAGSLAGLPRRAPRPHRNNSLFSFVAENAR